jgi:hypothetical protein
MIPGVNNPVGLAMMAGKLVVGAGAFRIVGSVVKNNVVTETPFQQVSVFAAKYFLGSAAAAVAERQLEYQVNEVRTQWPLIKKSFKEAPEKNAQRTEGP